MLLVPCPYCGPRPETSSAAAARPTSSGPPIPAAASDEDWAHISIYRTNPKGAHRERWYHCTAAAAGSTRVRDTVTDQFADDL